MSAVVKSYGVLVHCAKTFKKEEARVIAYRFTVIRRNGVVIKRV
jgi:hypothetical protein